MKENELKPRDAGYKYFTCPQCNGNGQISQHQFNELQSLREQLAQRDKEIENAKSWMAEFEKEKARLLKIIHSDSVKRTEYFKMCIAYQEEITELKEQIAALKRAASVIDNPDF